MTRSTFDPAYVHVTEMLRAIREKGDFSQRELSERLGRERSFISRLETSERRIDLLEFFWLCEACGADAPQEFAKLAKLFGETTKG